MGGDARRYYVGVQYKKPVGNSDGTFHNKRYFRCQQNHAIFCKSTQIMKTVKRAEESPDEGKRGGKRVPPRSTGSQREISENGGGPSRNKRSVRWANPVQEAQSSNNTGRKRGSSGSSRKSGDPPPKFISNLVIRVDGRGKERESFTTEEVRDSTFGGLRCTIAEEFNRRYLE